MPTICDLQAGAFLTNTSQVGASEGPLKSIPDFGSIKAMVALRSDE